ncbi:cyclohexanone monooxygenase [Dendrothele bispora CBS 962.96]|uniref:Cyclohexanone monooxygenase n=1 Tax=Dendrothele bispora (strain CBS 962.96) TaxID=1314807 RepID=A0A4S8L0E3_DENBC|nr:cyclohexanone monooxygenase [Dendrothele bispora CBS 962.96]
MTDTSLDTLIVGSGFAGILQLYQLRKLGHSVHVFDAAGDTGGTWWWNCYPGARVDSDVPLYEFSLPELWNDWTWSERFPGQKELRKYFEYVSERLDIRKDISFNTRVASATWDATTDRWEVVTENGKTVHPRFLVLCTGFSSTPYIPPFKGLETFKGVCHHTARWPRDKEVEVKGKRVGVIGTGASGVQIIQEIGREVKHLSVFQRTPNYALAMQQRKLTAEEQVQKKEEGLYPIIYRRRLQTHGGFLQEINTKSFFSATPEERRLHYEHMWNRGGFSFIIGNYRDYGSNDEANNEAYEFWRQKVHARVKDSAKAEILAPKVPPHPFGAKRQCLEQTYYEVYNEPHVTITDLSKYPIEEITPTGVKTADGVHHELDVLVLATGFDITGTITQIDVRGRDGKSLKEKWDLEGVYTNLGITVANFPNMFYTYGPQAPTAFSNGPTCTEIQCTWITECISYMIKNSLTCIEPTVEAQEDWYQQVWNASKDGPWMKAKGWYNNGNVPGRRLQPLNYTGGTAAYATMLKETAQKGYQGFTLSTKLPTKQVDLSGGKAANEVQSSMISIEA